MTIGGLASANLGTNLNLTSFKAEASSTPVEELTVEKYVEKYFSDIPILKAVAKCESQFRQKDKNGNTLRGVENVFDRGVMQINELYHKDSADGLGYDIMELSGNVAYARHLFEKEGLRPWLSSAPCWKKSQAYANYVNRGELAISMSLDK